MPSREAHIRPGMFFIVWGYYWTLLILRRYMKCRSKGKEFKATATYNLPWRIPKIGHIPFEGMLKILLPFTGLEIFGAHPQTRNVLHTTLYYNFMVSGVVDIVCHYTNILFPGSDYVMATFAFFMEAALLYFHIDDRSEVDVRVHSLLAYTAMACFLMHVLESRNRTSLILALSRAYTVIIQGSWWVGAGFILYVGWAPNPAWDMKSHDSAVWVAIYFSWHCAGHLLLMLVLSILVGLWYRYRHGTSLEAGDHTKSRDSAETKLYEYRVLKMQDEPDNS